MHTLWQSLRRWIHPSHRPVGWWCVLVACVWPLCLVSAGPAEGTPASLDRSSDGRWQHPPQLDELDHLTAADGLSHNTVWDIFQDSKGFMWLVTSEGLNRFDGYDFEVFQHDFENDNSLIANSASTLIEDTSGNLWIATGEGLDRYDPKVRRFTHYRTNPQRPESLRSNGISSLALDGEGRLWVATWGGLSLYRPDLDGFEHMTADRQIPQALIDSSAGPMNLKLSPSGVLWIGVATQLCRLLETPSPAFECHSALPKGASAESYSPIGDLAFDGQGRIWATTFATGLLRFDPRDGSSLPFRPDPAEPGSISSDQTTAIVATRSGQIWVGTDSSGLHWFDEGSQSFVRYGRDPHVPGGLSDNGVLSIFEDRQGLIWFGTYLGVDRYDPSREAFRTVRQHPEDRKRLAGLGVWAIHRDSAGELWVGTYTEGLERFDRRGRRLRAYRPDDPDPATRLRNGVVSGLVEEGSEGLWVGTWGGLHYFDRATEHFTVYSHDPMDPKSLGRQRVYHLFKDSRGDLWISLLGGGVNRLPADRPRNDVWFDRFEPSESDPSSLGSFSVYQVLEDHRGDLWFATGSGLHRRPAAVAGDAGPGGFVQIDGTAGDKAQAIYEDAEQRLWIGTDGKGLLELDGQRSSLRRYHRKDGLPSEWIMAILGDDDGRLWLSTSGGLVRMDPDSRTFQLFEVGDGLQGPVYTVGSAFASPEGELFFGGTAGFDRFWPSQVPIDTVAPKVELTDFLLFNRSAQLQQEDPTSPLAADIETLDRLTLDHRHYVFGFEFTGLHFADPQRNRYAYRLRGFDPKWVDTESDKRFAQYSNLPAGDYTFEVRAANEDGVWNPEPRVLAVTVLPPPWRTWWAYTLYGLAVLAAIVAFVHVQRRKLAYEQSVNARLRDVNRMKDEFLANTSHELRTPLYGIIGITESLLEGITGKLPIGTRQNLSLISDSAKRLSSLVNDILDFSKLSNRHLELQRGPVDLHSLCDVTLTLSAPLVGSKDVELRNDVEPDLPPVDADEARLQQILLNLVGNAIKFTEAGHVAVSVFIEGERVEVQVTDTGIGVPEAQRELIFKTFEQGDASTERQFGGTGLGLAVTKKLVVLHGGTIGVRSGPEGGAQFYFTLPLSDGKAPSMSPETEPERYVSTPLIATSEAPAAVLQGSPIELPSGELKILIVDDEPVNRQVLLNHLALEQFVVEQASSGPEALRIIEEGWTPDLVLLDVMMPKMSGYDVCTALRKRFSLAELPVIFLTAKNRAEDLLSGLAHGANDYLTKPITKAELLARVRLHLELLWVHRHLEEVVEERTKQVKDLGGLLPICGMCKSVRDDTGYWSQLEDYLRRNSDAMVTHGICPHCADEHYGDIFDETATPQKL